MTDKAEWGPWIEHDGKGCPAAVQEGIDIQARHRDGHISCGRIKPWVMDRPNWVWPKPRCEDPENDVVAFCIRKPRALLDLIDLVENLPAPAKTEVVG